MTLAPKVWRDAICRLQEEIPDFAFAAWISPLAVKIEGNRVVLGCPSSFHRDRIRIEYHDALERNLNTVLEIESDPGVSPARPSIDLVNMVDFAKMPGQSIASTVDIQLHNEREHASELGQEECELQASQAGQGRVGGARSMRSVSSQPTALCATGTGSATSGSFALAPLTSPSPRTRSTSPTSTSATRKAVGSATSDSGSQPTGALLSSVSVASTQPSVSATEPGSEGQDSNAGPFAAPKATPRAAKKSDPRQTELPFSFESFVVGPCNALAREAALALARTRQRSLNLLYLGGESGMGKTHLARATAAESRRHAGFRSPGQAPAGPRTGGARDVVYTSAELFTSEFVSAMRNGRSDDFKRRYRGPIGLLVVEDIQFFSGRVKTQLELFHTLTHVLDAGGRVLLTGDRTPRELTGLDDRVRTQVGRGFVAELEPPDALVRRHILRSKASAGGVRLPADCLDLLVEATEGSVRDVESMLIQVVTTSSLLGRSIDLGLTEEAIALKSSSHTALAPKAIAVSEIVRIVATFFGKRPEALASKSRRRDVLIPRQLAMYLAHRYTDASFAEIGRGLGRGHPSVRNAVERIERQVLENAPVRYQVEALSERIDQTLKNSNP